MNCIFDYDDPLLISPRVAEVIGLHEAIVLRQIHYWLNKNEENKINFREGRYWTFNTIENWQKQFPFWSVKTVERIFKKLESEGYILSNKTFNRLGYDRTKWYTINYQKLNQIR